MVADILQHTMTHHWPATNLTCIVHCCKIVTQFSYSSLFGTVRKKLSNLSLNLVSDLVLKETTVQYVCAVLVGN